MIITPHVLIGAIIGSKVNNFWLVMVLGVIFHFVVDKIPHWDYCISSTRKIKNVLKMFLDGTIGLFLVFVYIGQNNSLTTKNIALIILGIFFSLVPDILWFLFQNTRIKFVQKYISFHHNFHYKSQKEGTSTFFEFFLQIVVIIISLLILFVF